MYKIIDMHCDTIPTMYERKRGGEEISLQNSDLKIDLEKMKKGNYLCQCFSLFTCMEELEKRKIKPFTHVWDLAHYWKEEIGRYPDKIRQIYTYQDLLENARAGRISAVMAVEEGAVYEGKLENLYRLYDLGVRMSTITWNFVNELGYPNPPRIPGKSWNPDIEHGLTSTGIQFVEEMERLGILVDISHLNDAGIRDVFLHTKGPVIASHSNARKEAGHLRNLSDDMIRKIAERGGVIGANFFPGFLIECEITSQEMKKTLCASAEDVVRHMKYLKQTGGIDCVALGTDFDGFDGYMNIEHAGQMQTLADVMSKEGFSSGEIEKIFSENTMRVFREVWT